MPTLPLPALATTVSIDGGALPVTSLADVAAEWSNDIQASPTAPIRDAIQNGQLAMTLAYQSVSPNAAAQSDPLRATGEYLDEIGSYERNVHRQVGEQDPSYSARVNTVPSTVDPNDIIAAANGVLAPYTSVSCRYYEQSDALFLSNPATTTWSANLFALGDGGAGATPNYPDRRYSIIPNRRPMGAVLFNDMYGREFVLRTPDISTVDATVGALYQQAAVEVIATLATSFTQPAGFGSFGVYVSDSSKFFGGQLVSLPGVGIFQVVFVSPFSPNIALNVTETDIGGYATPGTVVPVGTPIVSTPVLPEYPPSSAGFFLGTSSDGVNAQNVSYLNDVPATSDQIFNAVIGAVEAIRGHSIRWALFADPNLTA